MPTLDQNIPISFICPACREKTRGPAKVVVLVDAPDSVALVCRSGKCDADPLHWQEPKPGRLRP